MKQEDQVQKRFEKQGRKNEENNEKLKAVSRKVNANKTLTDAAVEDL